MPRRINARGGGGVPAGVALEVTHSDHPGTAAAAAQLLALAREGRAALITVDGSR